VHKTADVNGHLLTAAQNEAAKKLDRLIYEKKLYQNCSERDLLKGNSPGIRGKVSI